MENNNLIIFAIIAAYLLMSNNKNTNCGNCCGRGEDTQSATVEVLGIAGTSTLMPCTVVPVTENSTVLSVSLDSFKKNQITFQTGGPCNDVYITSIGGLSQQANGPLSGWLYKVNDIFVDGSPATYKVKPGDRITWVYTTDLGKDVGAPEVIFDRRQHRTSFNNLNFNTSNKS